MSVKTRIQGADNIIYTEELDIHDCPSCGVVYATTSDFTRRRRSDGKTFYCPNGHTVVYNDHELGRLRKEVDRLKEARTCLIGQLDQSRAEAEHQHRRAAAARGQLTKMRNRVARGCCPDGTCKRSFTNLAEHVRTEHPEMIESLEAS
jgi:hypothetical protein